MKKITALTIGLLLAATPAFADSQISGTVVNQQELYNATGNAYQTYSTDSVGNGGVSGVGVTNSAGVINQNVNTGASSNVGSATNIAITGGVSNRGGNTDAGNPNNPTDQLAAAALNQVNAYNSTGNSICYGSNDTAYNAGVANVGVTGSRGVISQQINAGITSNVGSATGVAIH